MSVGDTTITVVGNIADEPELRFTQSGVAALRFSIASTPRQYDKATGLYKDGTAMFLRCTAWRELADHAAETLAKGMRVVVVGRLTQHNWTNEQGENRSMLQLEADAVGPELRFATAKVTKASRTAASTPSNDPWDTATPAASGGSEPPF